MALINTTRPGLHHSGRHPTGRPFYRPKPKFALIRCSRAYIYTVHANHRQPDKISHTNQETERDTNSCDDLYPRSGPRDYEVAPPARTYNGVL